MKLDGKHLHPNDEKADSDGSAIKRILFVDDEISILEGLRNVLRGERRRWQMAFAESGHAALELLAASPFDVAVVDMRMPEMSGVELLEQIRRDYPNVARIVLSGYADLATVAQASCVAHQHLVKPCDVEVLKSVVERACGLQELLENSAVRKAVGALGPLPSLPTVYQQLTRALTDPEVSIHRLAVILERDVGLATRVLKFANSAYFGFTKPIGNIEHAMVCIGTNALKHLVLSMEVFGSFAGEPGVSPSLLERFERHALLTARVARKLAPDQQTSDLAFAAGLLHDVGKLALAARLPEVYSGVMAAAEREKRPLVLVEKEAFGAGHAEIGAYLLGLWGLPGVLLDAVARHHLPRDHGASVDVSEAVRTANLLAEEVETTSGVREPPPGDPSSAMEQSEADRLESWRRMATEEARQLSRQ